MHVRAAFFYLLCSNFSFSSAKDTIANKPTLDSQSYTWATILSKVHISHFLISEACFHVYWGAIKIRKVCFGGVEDCTEALLNPNNEGQSSGSGMSHLKRCSCNPWFWPQTSSVPDLPVCKGSYIVIANHIFFLTTVHWYHKIPKKQLSEF